ncbi:LysR family transcriptional regulator [Zafaria sp. Z1313]|uniref:LysR family transcriptional regulator n=1 Tax=unclassified Zafaria TaxID=2828765 RepID=UPI002E786D3F|nr:LysR family transcriptional regulator [Zafaria sp. J156]MEE1622103.1 LysR family transcriptional regulator [Zafaria sp. J156]
MNLEQLRGFVEVSREGHFTRAAARLHLAQPSLSRQISTLEHELGSVLFHRSRGNISLTPAGELLLPLARRMLADADSVRRGMEELAGLRRGRVRIGATPTLCGTLVAEALVGFHAAHPGIQLHVTERGSRGLIEELSAGQLDLALVTGPAGRPGADASLDRAPLLREDLVVVSSAARPPLAAGAAEIGLAEVASLPQVVFHEGYELRATTDTAFRDAGLAPTAVVEGAEMDAVLRFVERGLGVAIVPAMVLIDRPGLRSARLAGPRLGRTISMAQRSDVVPTLAAQALRKAVVQAAAALVADAPGLALAT